MGYIPQMGYAFKVIHVCPDLGSGGANGAENWHTYAFLHNITVEPYFIQVKLQSWGYRNQNRQIRKKCPACLSVNASVQEHPHID
jgi:hypothetical protein